MKSDYREETIDMLERSNQAQLKIRNILKSFINIRSIKDFRQVNDIYRISRSIYTSIKQRPGMFFKVEGFFYSHLDNALNLVDSYTRLARMPRKSKESKSLNKHELLWMK